MNSYLKVWKVKIEKKKNFFIRIRVSDAWRDKEIMKKYARESNYKNCNYRNIQE